MGVEATAIHPDLRNLAEKNYVIAFEGKITVEAETQERAQKQAHDQLSHLGQNEGD